MSQLSEEIVLNSLKQIIDPDLKKDIVTLGFIRDLKIDGTSEESFDRSYVRLVRKLSQQERRQYALALFSILLPEKCLGSNATIALAFSPASPELKTELRPCRAQLDGKSYRDVVDAANAKGDAPSPATPPNTSLERTRER